MPVLENIRHERFAVLYVKSANASASYLKAGYNPTTRNSLDVSACQLLKNLRQSVELRSCEPKWPGETRSRSTRCSTISPPIESLRESWANHRRPLPQR